MSNIAWKKSKDCNGADACVEIAPLPNGNIGLRDSKNPDGPYLEFTPAEWSAFIGSVN